MPSKMLLTRDCLLCQVIRFCNQVKWIYYDMVRVASIIVIELSISVDELGGVAVKLTIVVTGLWTGKKSQPTPIF